MGGCVISFDPKVTPNFLRWLFLGSSLRSVRFSHVFSIGGQLDLLQSETIQQKLYANRHLLDEITPSLKDLKADNIQLDHPQQQNDLHKKTL